MNGVNKSNFLSYVKKTDIYSNLKYMENFDKKVFLSSINMNNPEIKEIVKMTKIDNTPEALLELLVGRMLDMMIDYNLYKKHGKNIYFITMFQSHKLTSDIESLRKKFKMFKNSEKFLDFIEKRFKFVANDTLRKISKTWDLFKNDKKYKPSVMDKINKKTDSNKNLESEQKNENQWINQKALKYIKNFDIKNWLPIKKYGSNDGTSEKPNIIN